MEIYPINTSLYLVEADVIETLETRTVDCAHSVVRNKEVLLPTHENILLLSQVGDMEVALLSLFLVGSERAELGPMLQIDFVC